MNGISSTRSGPGAPLVAAEDVVGVGGKDQDRADAPGDRRVLARTAGSNLAAKKAAIALGPRLTFLTALRLLPNGDRGFFDDSAQTEARMHSINTGQAGQELAVNSLVVTRVGNNDPQEVV